MTRDRAAVPSSSHPDGRTTVTHSTLHSRWRTVGAHLRRTCFAAIGATALVIGPASTRVPAGARTLREAPAATRGREDTTRFSHARHRTLACKSCHGTKKHGELLVRTERDCAACHHERSAAATTCRTCHSERELGKRLAVRTTMSMSVLTSPRVRELAFPHGEHERYECKSCHGGPDLAVDRSCASCHAEHHEPDANCRACHTTPAPRTAHRREVVHRGCTGSGCHDDAAVAALPAQRNVCLACHTRAVDHKPGRDCASCHQVNWPVATPGGLPRDE